MDDLTGKSPSVGMTESTATSDGTKRQDTVNRLTGSANSTFSINRAQQAYFTETIEFSRGIPRYESAAGLNAASLQKNDISQSRVSDFGSAGTDRLDWGW